MMLSLLICPPTVFVAGDNAWITVLTAVPCFFGVSVGENTVYDEENGVLRSCGCVRRCTVPLSSLEDNGGYSVRLRPVNERRAMFTDSGDEVTEDFVFRPIRHLPARLYFLSDLHGRYRSVLDAAANAGAFDAIVSLGDLQNSADDGAGPELLLRLCGALGQGELPTVAVRGNHDMRGKAAEMLFSVLPTVNGCSYFPFHLGPLSGVALDCAEDKDDSHEEYGNANVCAAFRARESAFLDAWVRKCAPLGDGEVRIALCHIPFPYRFSEPFSIERTRYAAWTAQLGQLGVSLLCCGHTHVPGLMRPGDENDAYGMAFPTAVLTAPGGSVGNDDERYVSSLVTVRTDCIEIRRVSSDGSVLETVEVPTRR